MIVDVVRDLLTPIQLGLSLEVKAIKSKIEEHADSMEQFEETLKIFKEEFLGFRLAGKYDS